MGLVYIKKSKFSVIYTEKSRNKVESFMEEIRLIEPTMEYADDIMMFRKETILANGGILEKEVLVDGEHIKRYWVSIA